MKRSDQSSKDNPKKEENTTLNDLLKKGTSKRDSQPADEFITDDPTRSVPDENENDKRDSEMGLSQKTKNQPSDERDASKRK